jgi:hypothetical protein
MGWDLGLNRTISRLIPTFMRNPRTYQWLKSLVFPLENINGDFKVFADVKKREAQLNSQTQLLQDYINVNFSPYFPNPDTDSVQIVHGLETAQATFFEAENPSVNDPFNSGHLIVYNEGETPTEGRYSPFTFFNYEDFGDLPEDFRLILPLSIQGNQSHVRSITAIVDRYAISTKSYDVSYTG